MSRLGQRTGWLRRPRGFTLVEVLIVVAILALLVAVLLGVSSSIRTQKNTALTKNCLTILDAALTEFHEITGHYPVGIWDDAITDSTCLIYQANLTGGSNPESDELLYLQLSILPQTREMIAKLPSQLIIEPLSGATVDIGGETTRYLQSIVDAWGNVLDYDASGTGFPLISSSGPDGPAGGTADDITNEN